MTSGASPCLPSNPQSFQIYEGMDDVLLSSPSHSLLYNLSVLRDKVQQLEFLVTAVVSPNQIQQESLATTILSAGNILQDIITSASSTAYALQQMGLDTAVPSNELPHYHMKVLHEGSTEEKSQLFRNNLEGGKSATFSSQAEYYHADQSNKARAHGGIGVSNDVNTRHHQKLGSPSEGEKCKESQTFSSNGCDIIEPDAVSLLAKYSHHCQVCGKGFKRDANLKMHMRAHGDEYKTTAALRNPMKNSGGGSVSQKEIGSTQKYSCPQEGCRWNRNHAKFQPLKSMACVKNHYKRSHCPKMYVCNRCNHKKFSVLSDLRTHEKHCGDVRWRCSCGTNFSRKDKLMGHVALFSGHSPVPTFSGK